MTTDGGTADLPERVTALETQVAELTERVRASEHDAAAARVLAGGADRDVNEFRTDIRDFRQATTASFNALREDLVDLRTEVRGKLDAAAAGQQHIVDLLTTLIDQQQGDQAGSDQ